MGEAADGFGGHLGVAGRLEERVGVRLDGIATVGLDDRLDSFPVGADTYTVSCRADQRQQRWESSSIGP